MLDSSLSSSLFSIIGKKLSLRALGFSFLWYIASRRSLGCLRTDAEDDAFQSVAVVGSPVRVRSLWPCSAGESGSEDPCRRVPPCVPASFFRARTFPNSEGLSALFTTQEKRGSLYSSEQ